MTSVTYVGYLNSFTSTLTSFSIEFETMFTKSYRFGLHQLPNHKLVEAGTSSSGTVEKYVITTDSGSEDHVEYKSTNRQDYIQCKIIKTGSKVYCYMEGNLVSETTYNWIGNINEWSVGISCWGYGHGKVKNLKIKPYLGV